MTIHVSGHHIEVTPALHNYVNEKFQRIEHHLCDLIKMDVSLHVEKNQNTAKANVYVKGDVLHAEAQDDNMYAAIDSLIDKVHRQAIKHKDKLHKHSD